MDPNLRETDREIGKERERAKGRRVSALWLWTGLEGEVD